ncbi:MAG: tRNA (adenosine(37)-N6)-dimethylallyltransferase MiaA [Pseudomonadales bacterium]|nr:tRNA (adenosine(37)-N6)-dimethylallyltransferase MiaA [Pseudomonadales bacterium]
MSGRTGQPPVLALVGPTAAGKTAAAFALADRRPVALISLDSAMVYRGMDIGTAKPSAAELARHPHALVDIRDPAEAYSVAEFLADADAAVRAALDAGRLPVLVGGTMLYLRAFREGLASLPTVDSTVRAALEREAEARGLAALHDELGQRDPVAAAGIHPNNPQRLLRALEVLRATGRPISAWWAAQAGTDVGQRLGVALRVVALVPDDRAALHARIAARFDAMLAAGFLDEVIALRARGDLHGGLPSMRAVGYRQAWRYLEGQTSSSEFREQGIVATRQLARRQLTWLRSWGWVETATDTPERLARRLATDPQLEFC